MFKVIYEEKVHTVYDVKAEYDWGYFGCGNGYDERRKFPSNTWFLIGYNDYFKWVSVFACTPVEQ